MGTLRMSVKERRRLELMSRVESGSVTLSKASQLLEISYRQAKRLLSRYRREGDSGLVHRLRGRASNRTTDGARRQKVLDLYAQKYHDFGPTLASEYLGREEGIAVAVETLRRWLREEGLWTVRRRGSPHRRRRPRKEQRGEMVQMDGSWHDWFEGRRAWATLMVVIDDATNQTYARFFEQETTEAAMETFGRYIGRHGVPHALYVDRDSIYRPGREETLDESLRGETALTQFGRSAKELGVELILANSPQAKGRVERRNGVFQDRLVKAMRLEEIDDLTSANTFLEKRFLRELNRRFTVVAATGGDLHRTAPPKSELERILSFQETRLVQNDWTVRWHNRWLQIGKSSRSLALAGKKITVLEQLNGKVRLLYRAGELKYEELGERPAKEPQKRQPTAKATPRPRADHPWRRGL